MSKLLNSGQIGNISYEHMKKIRQETQDKWANLGFLDGLSGHVKPHLSELYCCQASTLLNTDTTNSGETLGDVTVFIDDGKE